MFEIISSIFFLFILAVILYFRHQELKEFNHGHCKCGGSLKTFDMDSQGGTGWKCNCCGNGMWTSWVNTTKFIQKRGF